MKFLTWQNPEQLFVAQELINKVKSKCCGIKGILSLAGIKNKDIVKRLYRFKGVEFYLKMFPHVYGKSKHSPLGFLYRVIFKIIKMYIEKVN